MVSWCARKSGQGETVGAIATNPGQSAMVANNQSARHRTFVLKTKGPRRITAGKRSAGPGPSRPAFGRRK